MTLQAPSLEPVGPARSTRLLEDEGEREEGPTHHASRHGLEVKCRVILLTALAGRYDKIEVACIQPKATIQGIESQTGGPNCWPPQPAPCLRLMKCADRTRLHGAGCSPGTSGSSSPNGRLYQKQQPSEGTSGACVRLTAGIYACNADVICALASAKVGHAHL